LDRRADRDAACCDAFVAADKHGPWDPFVEDHLSIEGRASRDAAAGDVDERDRAAPDNRPGRRPTDHEQISGADLHAAGRTARVDGHAADYRRTGIDPSREDDFSATANGRVAHRTA
jgi:hypothetical protein